MSSFQGRVPNKPNQLFLLLALLLLNSCGSGLRTKPDASREPLSAGPLQFTVSGIGMLSDRQLSIYEKIQAGEPVAFGEVTHALIERHHAYWQAKHEPKQIQSVNDYISEFQSFLSPLPADMGEAKVAIENNSAKRWPGRLIYNSQAVSYLNVLHFRRTQSYSGTYVMELALRETLGRDAFEALNPVVIYESGHVLPGYVRYVTVGKEQVAELVGIETTVAGQGRVLYGPIKDLGPKRMLRIVDANLWAIIELFKFKADNLVDLSNQALRLTSEKYGIPNVPYLVASSFKIEIDTFKIQWSPLGFGNPDIGRNDRERSTFDQEPRAKLPIPNPNSTIYHSPGPTKPTPKIAVDLPSVVEGPTIPSLPYREVPTGTEERRFECWDYSKSVWVKMPVEEDVENGYFIVLAHPCKASRTEYPPLPLPLKEKVEELRDNSDDEAYWDSWDSDY